MADKELALKISADAKDARRSIADVAGDVETLAEKLGGELGAKAQEAAAKLRALGEQEAAVKAFLSLQTQVGASERALKELTGEADRYGAQIAKSGPPTAQEAANLQRLRAAADAAATGLAGQKEKLGAAAGEMQRLGIATDGASRTLSRIRGDIANTATSAGQLDPRIAALTKGLTGAGGAADDLARRSTMLDGTFRKLATSLAGLFAVGKLASFAKDAISVADAYGQMAERIRMATANQEEYDLVQKRLLESANITYRSLSEQQELYIRTADALRSMGYQTSQALDITDSFTFLLATNAASAEKAGAAIDAYTKSIQSGKVDAQSWQSILAATPTIVDAISKATGKAGEDIRQLGVTGRLSITDLNEGLRQTVELNKAATEGMKTTVHDAITRLSNTWSAYIGEANRATQTTDKMVKLLDTLSNNLDTVVSLAVTAGEVMAAVWGVKALQSLTAYIGSLRAAAAATSALTLETLAAASAAEKLTLAGKLAGAAWIGWEIGTVLREKFEAVNLAGIALAAGLQKSAARAQGAWEMAKAVFTDDTIDAAQARMQKRLQEIDDGYAGLFAEAMRGEQQQQKTAAATKQAGDAAGIASVELAKLKEGYEKVNAFLAQNVELADKAVQAANARGQSMVAQAKLLGDEGALRRAVGAAAELESTAIDKAALARQNEVASLQQELKDKTAAYAVNGQISAQRQQELKDLSDLIAAKQLEADKTSAQAQASAANARAKGEEAQAATAATEAARAAAITRKAESDSAISLLQTQKQLAGQSEEMARLMGNEEAARRFRIQQMEIDIRITQAKAEAMRAEAQGSIAVAQATLEELRVKGELTKVKEAELNASIKVAEAKLKEADAIRQSAGVTQQAINNMREFGDEAGRAGRAGAHAGDQVAGSWHGAAGAIRDASAAQKEFAAAQDLKYGRAGQSATLGTQKSGALSPTMLGNTWQSIFNLAKGMGASEADSRRIADSMFDGSGKYIGQKQQRFGESATAAAARMAGEAVRFAPPKSDQTGQSGRPAAGAGAAASYVSHITIPGLGTTSAGFADQASQNNVTNLLKRLAADKQRAM